jgi:SWI/SNF-related matrix-associated actin-dependent regulator 1 of chromatin subfamily A
MPTSAPLHLNHFGNGKTMMPFQEDGLGFVEAAGGNAMIADQPGLGKTCQSLAYLALHPDLRPAVIVCPASLKINWAREAEMWMETGDVVEVIKTGKPHPLTCDIGIIIINYDVLKKWLPELKAIKPQIIIFDESHFLKSAKSARTKAAAQLAKIAPHKILLTGTPVINRPAELWKQLQIIDPKTYSKSNFFTWHRRYTDAKQLHFGQKTVWDFSGASNLNELADSLKNIMIRRTKDEVLPELPAKRRQTLLVSIDNRREYNHAEKDFLSWIKEQKGHEAAERASSVEQLSMVEALRQIAIQGKMKQAIEWVYDFLETGEKLVVFATHRATIDTLMNEFSKVAVRLDGGMCAEEKQLSVDRFQGDPEIRLFVGNIQAAGVGITLTEASNVLFAELGWTPSLHEQAEDRTHRIGQKNAVNIYYMIAENTIDAKIADMLEAKGGITSTGDK